MYLLRRANLQSTTTQSHLQGSQPHGLDARAKLSTSTIGSNSAPAHVSPTRLDKPLKQLGGRHCCQGGVAGLAAAAADVHLHKNLKFPQTPINTGNQPQSSYGGQFGCW